MVDHFGTPALLSLAVENVASDFVIEPDLFGVSRQNGPLPSASDTLFERSQPVVDDCLHEAKIVGRRLGESLLKQDAFGERDSIIWALFGHHGA